MTMNNGVCLDGVDLEREAVERILNGPLVALVKGEVSLDDARSQVLSIRLEFNAADWWYVNAMVEGKLRTGDALFEANVLDTWSTLMSADDKAAGA